VINSKLGGIYITPIAKAVGDVPELCLWISEYGIWPSTENWHLYYALRQKYGDTADQLDTMPCRRIGSYS
jgi:hypothetical protein